MYSFFLSFRCIATAIDAVNVNWSISRDKKAAIRLVVTVPADAAGTSVLCIEVNGELYDIDIP